MPQNTATGRKGRENGYIRADEIGILLGAVRISYKSNEFCWKNKVVLIKTGPSAVVTRATLAKVESIIYGERVDVEWRLYQIDPDEFERLSVQSRSRSHNENYRSVSRKQMRYHGRRI